MSNPNILSSAFAKAKELIKNKQTAQPQAQAAQPQAQAVQAAQAQTQQASLFNDYFNAANSAMRNSGSSANDARNEQMLMRQNQRLQQQYGEEYDTALAEYEESTTETTDIIPQAPDEIMDSTDLCQYFGYSSISELKEAVEITNIIDFHQLENGGYSRAELQDAARRLDEELENIEAQRQERLAELVAEEQYAQDEAAIAARVASEESLAQIEAEIAGTETDETGIKDIIFTDIEEKAVYNGVPREVAVYFAKEVLGKDFDTTLQLGEDGNYYFIDNEDNDKYYLCDVIGQAYDYSPQITTAYRSYLRDKQPERYALAKTMLDNPQSASKFLIQSYGGDGYAAAEGLQAAINNSESEYYSLFTGATVTFSDEKGLLIETEEFGTLTFDDFVDRCKITDNMNGTTINQNVFLTVIVNSDLEPAVSEKDDAISALMAENSTIEENIDGGTPLAQALYNAETREDAYDVILTYCGFNTEVADGVYQYLLGDDSLTTTSDNPFKGRNTASLMSMLYTNLGDKYVLNQSLLNKFTEIEAYDYDEDEKLIKRPTKEYYINLNGELCTRNWTHIKEGKRENIKISLEENGSTREIEFYTDKNSAGEMIYYIKPQNEDDEPIVETEDEFFRRLVVAQNYSILEATNPDLMSDEADMSTEKISEYYAILADYDKNTAETLVTILHELSSEGIADDAYNGLKDLFGLGISKSELLEEVGAHTEHTLIMSYYINGQDSVAQGMVEDELERRLQSAQNYQEIHDILLDCYQDEDTVLVIMNSGAVNPPEGYGVTVSFGYDSENNLICTLNNGTDTFEYLPQNLTIVGFDIDFKVENIKAMNPSLDLTISQERAYSFLSNGGVCTPQTVKAYNIVSEQFTDYNTAILAGNAIEECKTPEDAFYLITGKKIDDPTLTDDDIKKFNDFYNIENSAIKPSGYMESNCQIGVSYDKEKGFQLLYRDDKSYKELQTFNLPLTSDEQENYQYGDLPGEILSAFYDEKAMKNFGLSVINDNYFAESISNYQQQKFEEYYEKNKEQVDKYITDYAAYIEACDKDSKEYKYFAKILKDNGYDGVSKDNIIAYLNSNPEARYNESCKYMQYGYTTAKTKLYGESRLDAMTNKYCQDMATYSSNLSHVISMGCMVASVMFPAAAPALMMGAKAAGYVDNAIDLVNMLTNRQNYMDDDYLGWAKSTGFEYLTKRGYMYFSGLAGDNAEKLTEWLIDRTGGANSYLANHALAQILFRGSAEAVIETGICIPWTMMIKSIQGGEYNLLDELKENFIYDFLPYARGWQDLLIGRCDTVLYEGDGNYYRWQNGENGEERIYVDPDTNKILGISLILANGDKLDLVKYTYEGDDKVIVTEMEADGKTVKQVRIQENDGNKITYCDGVDDDGNPINPTKVVEAQQYSDGSCKIVTSEPGKPDVIETRDTKGRIQSIQQGNTTVEYNPKSGQRKALTITGANGNEAASVAYRTTWGGQEATIKTSDGYEFTYRINTEGKAVIDLEGDDEKQIIVEEGNIIAMAQKGYSADYIERIILASSEEKPTTLDSSEGVEDAQKPLEEIEVTRPVEEQQPSEEKPEFNQDQYERAISSNMPEEDARKVATAGLTESQENLFLKLRSEDYSALFGDISTDDLLLIVKSPVVTDEMQVLNIRGDSRNYNIPISLAVEMNEQFDSNQLDIARNIVLPTCANCECTDIDIIRLTQLVEWSESNSGNQKAPSLDEVIKRVAKYDTSPASAAWLIGLGLDDATEGRVYNICKTYQDDYKFTTEDVVKLAKADLSDDQCDRVFELNAERNIPFSDGIMLMEADLSDDQYNRVFEMNAEKGIPLSSCILIENSDLSDEQKELASSYCADNGIPVDKAIEIAQDPEGMRTYLESFTDLRAMTDVNGVPIFGDEIISEERAEQLKAEGEDVVEINGKYYLMNTSSISYFTEKGCNNEVLIDMVQQGYLPKKVLSSLPKQGEMSDFVSGDLDKICAAYYSGTPIEDVFVPKVTLEDIEAGKIQLGEGEEISIKPGDVVELDGYTRPCIINEDGSVTELNISKETYLALFPPVERFATVQNQIGNCWECSGFNAVYRDPATRHYILDMFSEDSDGNITITYPNSGRSYTFVGGQLPDGTDMRYYSQGAPAVQMLEWANGREIQAERRDAFILNGDLDKAQEKGLITIEDGEIKFADNAYIDENGEISAYNGKHGSPYEESRHSGRSSNFFRMIGMSNPETYTIPESSGWDGLPDDIRGGLSNAEFFENNVVVLGTVGKQGSAAESVLNQELGLVSSHAYQLIAGEVAEDGTILTYKILNPHGMVEVEIEPDKLEQFVGMIHVASKGDGVSDASERPVSEEPAAAAVDMASADDERLYETGADQARVDDEADYAEALEQAADDAEDMSVPYEDDGVFAYDFGTYDDGMSGADTRDYLRERLLTESLLTDDSLQVESLDEDRPDAPQLSEGSRYFSLGEARFNQRTNQWGHTCENLKDMPDENGVRGKNPLFGRNVKGIQYRLTRLQEAGISTVIDLRSTGECSAKALTAMEQAGMRYVNFPVEDGNWTADSLDGITSYIATINDGDFYVGCANGQARTDLAVGINYVLNPNAKNVPTLYYGSTSSSRVSVKDNISQILTLVQEKPEIVLDWGWNSYDEFVSSSSVRLSRLLSTISR